MQCYLDLLADIMENGTVQSNRTGVKTKKVFGRTLRFDLTQGSFPLLTTKKVHFKSVAIELLWFLRGETNIRFLKENGVKIWDEWADENGELGPVYGKQWRSWLGTDGKTYDQIKTAIGQIIQDPDSRRIIVNAWKVDELEEMALPPCHMFFQFDVTGDYLNLLWYQRSVDTFLGLPFNIASYALLLKMVAQVTGKKPGELVASLGNVHIYENHYEQVLTQMTRKPRELPELYLNPAIRDIDQFTWQDLNLNRYFPYEAIKAPIAV